MNARPLRRVDGKRLHAALAFALALVTPFAAHAGEPGPAAWNGVWQQIWGEFTPMKVVVRDGKVVEWLYRGGAQPAAC